MRRWHEIKLRFYADKMLSPLMIKAANSGVVREMLLGNVLEVRMQACNGRLLGHNTPYLGISIVCM